MIDYHFCVKLYGMRQQTWIISFWIKEAAVLSIVSSNLNFRIFFPKKNLCYSNSEISPIHVSKNFGSNKLVSAENWNVPFREKLKNSISVCGIWFTKLKKIFSFHNCVSFGIFHIKTSAEWDSFILFTWNLISFAVFFLLDWGTKSANVISGHR